MKNIIRRILEEFQEWEVPLPISREVSLPDFPPSIRKVQVLMGVRRAGKTWILYQKMHSLLNAGLDKRKILYLNFEDDRLNQFLDDDFQTILDSYFDLYPDLTQSNDLAFFFDEIHLIPGWEKFIRRLIDQEKMQLFVTGSSAKMLSSEIATTLRGRGWPQEVFPCSFSEYASFKGWDQKMPLTAKNCSKLKQWANDYLIWGGFPEALYISQDMHSALLQNYVNSVVFRDVIDRYQLKNAHVVKLFLMHCLQQLAAPLSVNKTFNRLKSQGIAIGKNSLYDYLSYFEDAYALFSVPIFNYSEQKRHTLPKKIYAVDTGIISAYSIKPHFEIAARLENAVFCSLRRLTKEIFYYKTHKQLEVDFVTISSTGQLQIFQVCHDMQNPETRQRELQAAIQAAEELQLNICIIITNDTEEILKQGPISIDCIPYWKWALQLTKISY